MTADQWRRIGDDLDLRGLALCGLARGCLREWAGVTDPAFDKHRARQEERLVTGERMRALAARCYARADAIDNDLLAVANAVGVLTEAA